MDQTDRNEFGAFHEILGREWYLHHSGQRDLLELEPIYDRYSDPFSFDRVKELRRCLAGTPPVPEKPHKSALHFLRFATEHCLHKEVRRLTGEIATTESGAMLRVGGGEISFYQSSRVLAVEPSPLRRRELYDHRLKTIEELQPLREDRIRTLQASSRTLGWKSYKAFCEDATGVDYNCASSLGQQFLTQTAEMYHRNLSSIAQREIGVPAEHLHRADLNCFLTAESCSPYFPPGGARDLYVEELNVIGVNPHRQDNIQIDAVDRPRKAPRAFCVPIKIPCEIFLVISPVGGSIDYEMLLHEGGHAQHLAHSSPSLDPEFRYTGDTGLS